MRGLLSALRFVASTPAFAEQDFSKVEIKSVHVSKKHAKWSRRFMTDRRLEILHRGFAPRK